MSDSYWHIDGQSHIQSNQAKRGQGDISKKLVKETKRTMKIDLIKYVKFGSYIYIAR